MGAPQRAGMLAMGATGTSAARWSLLTIALAALLLAAPGPAGVLLRHHGSAEREKHARDQRDDSK